MSTGSTGSSKLDHFQLCDVQSPLLISESTLIILVVITCETYYCVKSIVVAAKIMPRQKLSGQTKAPKTTKRKKPAKKSKKEVAEEEKRQREKHLLDLISQRDQATQARVDKLSADQMKNLIQIMMRKNPAFVFHVMEENEKCSSSSTDDDQLCTTPDAPSSPPPLPESNPNPWCTCGNCRPMPSLVENVCCKGSRETCIARVPEFSLLILEPMVLNMASNYRNDFLGLSDEDEEDLNKSFRHSAYRQYTLWRHGYLGANNRKVIPSCCALAIREKFPSPHGIYTGYKPDRLA